MATPLLRVTNAGAAAATTATPTGPYIHITRWKLADGYGYSPQAEDTDLNGSLVYVDVPKSYQNMGDNTMDIVCQLPPTAGPFQYGEIGIYIEDSNGNEVLFAKGVWDSLQSKESSLGTNINSQVTFHCLIKLQQSIAILRINTKFAVSVYEVDRWSDVIIPTLSANSEVPLTLVRELDNNNDSTLLQTNLPTNDSWTIGTNYDFLASTTIVNATSTSVTVPLSAIPLMMRTGYVNRRLVIELPGSSAPFRSVSALGVSGSNAILNLNPAPLASLPPVGAPIVLYEQKKLKVVSIATRDVPGIVKPGDGINITTDGTISTSGLLHGTPGTGRQLVSSDNLNATTWTSGEYWAASSLPGGPPGVTVGGRIRISRPTPNGDIFMQYFPTSTSTANYSNVNNLDWKRYWLSSSSTWTPWQSSLRVGNGLALNTSGIITTSGLLHGVPGSGQPLTSAHNLNSTTFGSGEYSIASSASRPSNGPPGVTQGGRLRISNYNGHILQEYFPINRTTDLQHPDANVWWRIWNSAGWTAWRRVGTPPPATNLTKYVNVGATGTNTYGTSIYLYFVLNFGKSRGSTSGAIYVNNVRRAYMYDTDSSNSWYQWSATVAVPAGQAWRITGTLVSATAFVP